jgi:DNA-binding transcriptional LysR family regulator
VFSSDDEVAAGALLHEVLGYPGVRALWDALEPGAPPPLVVPSVIRLGDRVFLTQSTISTLGSSAQEASGPFIANDMPTMLGAAVEGLGLAQVPEPIAAGAVKAGKFARVLERFAPMAPAAGLHRSREEPSARQTACQSENVLTARAGENAGAGEGNRTLVFSLEVRRFREVLQRFFRQIAAKHPP